MKMLQNKTEIFNTTDMTRDDVTRDDVTRDTQTNKPSGHYKIG